MHSVPRDWISGHSLLEKNISKTKQNRSFECGESDALINSFFGVCVCFSFGARNLEVFVRIFSFSVSLCVS